MPINRLLVVGYGSMGQRHLRIARVLLPQADIRVLRHREHESIPEDANGCLYRLEDALAFSPEAAVIASPSPFHMQTALPLAVSGAHLLVEKPLATTLEQIPKLLKTCAKQNTVLMTAYNLRFMPSLREYRNRILEGVIGKVMSIRCEVGQHLSSWRPGTDYRQGVSASRALGGGVLLELSHEIDYLTWIFGSINKVQAVLSTQSDLVIDVEDTAHIIFKFSETAAGRQVIACLNMDFVRHDTSRWCIAIGEEGSLRWNGLLGTVDIFSVGEKNWKQLYVQPSTSDQTYIAEWQHFLNCIRNGIQPSINGEDGLSVLQIIEAIRYSSASAQEITVQGREL